MLSQFQFILRVLLKVRFKGYLRAGKISVHDSNMQ